jgi:glycosyltransferase involved in cell wall biosynthesis
MRVADDVAWELIVVNNNSTDHTDAVIAEYRDRLPLRRQLEPLQGHSNARNRAIAAARGEYIVWTDDDVIVGARWLAAYAEAFRRWPDAVVFGGRIVPRYEPPVVKWIAESERVLGGPFAIRDFGDEVQPLSVAESRIPYGANFAVRTAEQRMVRYDPNLGLAPNRRRYDDEVDVITRLLASGTKGYWIPHAIVEHCIGQERQTVDYIAAFNEGWGETCAFRDADTKVQSSFWFGIPRRIWPRLFVWGCCIGFAATCRQRPIGFNTYKLTPTIRVSITTGSDAGRRAQRLTLSGNHAAPAPGAYSRVQRNYGSCGGTGCTADADFLASS